MIDVLADERPVGRLQLGDLDEFLRPPGKLDDFGQAGLLCPRRRFCPPPTIEVIL